MNEKEMFPLIEKITGRYEVGAAAKAKKGYKPELAAGAADEASFSVFAVELARVSGELKNIPDVREDLVDAFKKQVESGEYNPPLQAVAHSLFMAGILNGEE